MAVPLYDATIGSFLQGIDAAIALLDKAGPFAQAAEIDEAALIDRRLAPDMLPFGYQVKSIAVHSEGAIEGVRRGSFSPDTSAWATDMAGLSARLAEARGRLAAVDADEVESLVGRDMRFVAGSFVRAFTAELFLLSFSVPNFYFHLTTAYDLLRAAGMGIGKVDYLGRPRVKA